MKNIFLMKITLLAAMQKKIKMNRNKKNRIPCKLLYNKNSQLLIGCFCFLRKYSIVCFNYMSDVNTLSNA